MTENTDLRQQVLVSSAADTLLDDYLNRLHRAARRLPSWQRQLFLDEAAARIDADLGNGAEVDLEQMRTLLGRLGDPESLVQASVITADWPGGQELAAVLLLLIGGVVLPVIGWLAGIVLLWASPRWRAGDKLLGTLVWPGGLAGLGVLAWLGIANLPAAHDRTPGFVLLGGLAIAVGVPPVLVAIRLLHRARRPIPNAWLAAATTGIR